MRDKLTAMSEARLDGTDDGNAKGGAKFEHWAFISYSREDNRSTRGENPSRRYVLWAEWLQDALENYRVPKDLVGTLSIEECFVPALLHPLNAEGQIDASKTDDMPLAADVRWGEAKREILAAEWKEASLAVERARLHLLSGILGVDLDDLVQRDKVRQLAEAKELPADLALAVSAV